MKKGNIHTSLKYIAHVVSRLTSIYMKLLAERANLVVQLAQYFYMGAVTY